MKKTFVLAVGITMLFAAAVAPLSAQTQEQYGAQVQPPEQPQQPVAPSAPPAPQQPPAPPGSQTQQSQESQQNQQAQAQQNQANQTNQQSQQSTQTQQQAPQTQQNTQGAGAPQNQSGGTLGSGQQQMPQSSQQQGQQYQLLQPSLRRGTIYRVNDLINAQAVDASGRPAGSLLDVVLTESGRIPYWVVQLDSYQQMLPARYLVPARDVTVLPVGNRPRIIVDSVQPDREFIQVQNDLQIRQQISRNSILFTTLQGYPVVGSDGSEVGAIDDVVVNTERDEVVYAAFAPGGSLGAGGKLIAVPFTDIRFNSDRERATIDASKKQIERADGFTGGEWPAEPNRQWKPYF